MNLIDEDKEYLKTLTVLYVEDEEDVREQFSQFLSRIAGTLIIAKNGLEGVKAYHAHNPDIIITDIQMPVMGGLGMTREIRGLNRSVPIIILTASDQGDDLIKFINLGVDRYATKPVDVTQLIEALLSCAHRLLVDEKLNQTRTALKNERQRLTNIIDGTHAGTWEWNVPTGETIFNKQWAKQIGYRHEEISPVSLDTWINIVHPDDLQKCNELLEKHFSGASDSFECEIRMRHKNGQWLWILSRGKVATWSEDGKPLWMFGTHQDISERKRIEVAVVRAKKEWEQTFDSVSDLISIIDTSHTIMRVNRAMANRCGLTPQEIIGRKCHEVLHCTRESITNCPLEKANNNKSEHRVELEISSLKGIFEIRVSPIFESGDSITNFVHVMRDVTRQKQIEQELHKAKAEAEALSKTDGLTGIANRRHFNEVLTKEYARHTRSGSELSLIILDIDLFKKFNDTYGHVAGDECLQQVARVIAECTNRPADLASRYGGEEFACILPETDQRGALLIAENIRQGIIDLAIPNIGSTIANCVTASLGVITDYVSLDDTATDIVARADELLYRAKSLGRNRVEYNAVGPA